MAQIEFLSGSESGKVIDLAPGRHVLGRAATADVQLTAETISGRHLQVEVTAAGAVRFEDLGSTNGTWSGGMKVTAGEWTPGNELKLGNFRMRLLDPNAARLVHDEPAESAASASALDSPADASHRRARAEAMQGGRKGGGLALLGIIVLVVAAGGAYWWFAIRDAGGDAGSPSGSGTGAAAAPAVRSDLIDDLGKFEAAAAEAWSLDKGVTLENGALRSSGALRYATLTQRFPLYSAALQIEAQPQGLQAWPEVQWGLDEEDAPRGTWLGPVLGSGPVAVVLPAEAQWFRLSLALKGDGRVSGLTVEEGDGVAQDASHDSHSYVESGGNLLLRSFDRALWASFHANAGSWQPVEGGFDFQSSSPATLLVAAGPEAAAGGVLLLADGGPVRATGGVVLEDCPGLMLGTGSQRLELRFAQPQRVAASERALRVQLNGGAQLRWSFADALAEAKGLAREIERAASAGDSALVLSSSARLLRDFPLDEDDLDRASQLRRGVLTDGRAELGRLQVRAAEALFFESIQNVEEVHAAATSLATRLPGTDIARESEEMSTMLIEAGRRFAEQESEERRAYRTRLRSAIDEVYPLIAAWLDQEASS